jgi:hypothetical protein
MSMPQFQHKQFIETPIIKLLHDVVSDSNNISNGMEFYSTSGYIMHSLFLRMTGAQEQKFKCVCWDLATVDYEYRYSRYNKWELGECSKLKDKSTVFSDLVNAVKAYNPKYSVFGNSSANKVDFLAKTLSEIKKILDGSNLVKCFPGEYADFEDIFSHLHHNNLEAGNQLFCCADNTTFENMNDEHVLAMTYTLLYKHRNRCAHNTLSYQINIPTFQELNNVYVQKYYNIFLFVAILISIDRLLMQVYRKYQKVLIEF